MCLGRQVAASLARLLPSLVAWRRFQPPIKEPTVEAAETTRLDASKFAIGFDHRDRARLFELWTEVLDSEQWSEGRMLEAFERRWSEWNGLPSLGPVELGRRRARRARVRRGARRDRALPVQHLHGDAAGGDRRRRRGRVRRLQPRRPLHVVRGLRGARPSGTKPKAAILVHIGGHIAFDSERIAAYCREHGIFLLEDCAHAHGAGWNGRRPGGFGDAGVYSLYATKTVSTGEGGVLVSANPELIEFAAKFRNYGKFEHEVDGLNFRMSEFTAALGLVQAERMEEIVAWKNAYAREHLDPLHPARLELPDGMTSGLYKYIVFDPIEKSTGRVYEQPCHRIMGRDADLPNTDWVAENHWCVPLYYRPESREAALGKEDGMRVLVTGGGGFIGSHVVDRLIERGDTPRIFDLSASPYHSPLEVETFTGSITDPANLDLAMRDCDAVIHLAAVADVAHVLADPVLAEEVNTRGTLNVLEAACRAKVGRVVYGSTTWVYSDCAEQAVDEDTPIPAPRHLYTATKLAGETYCAGYAELYDLEYTVLRFGIPYGPRARAAGVVAKFTDLAFEGKALTIAGDGSQTRSFIYVEDLADGIVASLAPEAAGRTYNLSGDEVVTILEIAERVQENTDGCEIVHTPPRPGDFPGKEISNERALEEIGWKAATSFREGVRRYVEWVRNTTRPPDPVPGLKPVLSHNGNGNGTGNGRPAGALLEGAAGAERAPAAGAGADRRHRRGPRPAGADDQGRRRAGDPGARSRSSTACRRWGGSPPRSPATARASPSAGCRGCSTSSTG